MESFFIEIGGNSFHVSKYGKGDRLLLCFHGYGESAAHFAFLEPLLGNKFTLLAFDMPFHGATKWEGSLLMEVDQLIALVDRASGSPTSRFSIMGYSMGGRVSLRLFQEIPERIEQMVLVAPDGFHKNPWQRFSTQTLVGNALFKFTMENPKWLFGLMNWAFKLGLLNRSIEKFVRYYLEDPAQRTVLYKRWTTMRRFRPNLSKLKYQIQQSPTVLHVFFGKYDRVIVAYRGHQFARGLEDKVKIVEIEAGHQLLHEKYATILIVPFIAE